MFTRARDLAKELIEAYDGEDTTNLELIIQRCEVALQKFVDAANLVMADKRAERAWPTRRPPCRRDPRQDHYSSPNSSESSAGSQGILKHQAEG